MMKGKYIFRLASSDLPISIGNKASNLKLLLGLNMQIPDTYVCTWEAYLDFLSQGDVIRQAIKKQLAQTLDPNKTYAVRSSVNVEDTLEHSFAGQFSTILEVHGLDALVDAIKQVWISADTDGVQSYRQNTTHFDLDIKVAVLIQEMVTPILSGVVFSKNPITGLDEIVIEAVEGVGTALVQDGVTPLRWVHKHARWLEQPSGNMQYEFVAQQVVEKTSWIAKKIGKDIDLEWVYDGKELFWVQLREITALQDLHIYSNKISKEFLPGLIKPLIWSINIPLVNSAWVDLLTEVIGENDIEPESMSKSFYYRAYFDMTIFAQIFDLLGMPRESLEISMGIIDSPENRSSFKPSRKFLSLLPGLVRFMLDKWRFARRVEANLPQIETQFKNFENVELDRLSLPELFEQIDRLYKAVRSAAYFDIVVPLLMFAYHGVLRRQLTSLGINIDEFNLANDMKELQEYEPVVHLERLNSQFGKLEPALQDSIQAGDYQAFEKLPDIEDFQNSVRQFIIKFGHLSDNGNDFSFAPWRENKDLILKLITNYQRPENGRSPKLYIDSLPVMGLRRWLVNIFYQRARQFRYYRERVSSAYTYGYGLFRKYYLAVGEHFARTGLLRDSKDIFYLYDREIRRAASVGQVQENYIHIVNERKKEIDDYQDINLPEIIYGDQPPPIVTSQEDTLHGTPTSRGVYHGPIRVVRGIQDFDKLNYGDVLVIPFSDVGWTPLFSRAGAVISESGGMLSHSSIIAREYGIPAVVSVPGALNLPDDMLVTVDGYRGIVFLSENNKNRN